MCLKCSLNKGRRNVIVIFVGCGTFAGSTWFGNLHVLEYVLKIAELLGSYLLQNIGEHVLEILGLGVALEHQQLFAEGVLY